jgi:hypothetical protein
MMDVVGPRLVGKEMDVLQILVAKLVMERILMRQKLPVRVVAIVVAQDHSVMAVVVI